MQVGSEAHMELFCRTFLEGHRKYEPEDLPWPELDDQSLELLRGIPFWDFALQAEADAGPMVHATADVQSDPLIREALSLQGYEEDRHARIIRHMIGLYGLEVGEIHVEMPADIEEAYIDFGFEECLDSFGAFGLFELARESKLVPEPLFQIFDHVMNEEAHHIVFFVNWFAHRQRHRGVADRALRVPKSLWHYGKALWKIADMFRSDDTPEGQDFVVTGAQAFVDDLTPKLVISTCLAENARRMAPFDPRLLQPRLIPRMAQVAWAGLRLLPGSRKTSAGEDVDSTPRAA
jgi:hypothetical protein